MSRNALKTYLLSIHRHQPINHIIEQVYFLDFFIFRQGWLNVCKVDPRYSLMLPALTKGCLVIEQRQFLDDVIHNQINVNRGFVSHMLLECLTQLAHLGDVEALVRIQLQHPRHHSFKLLGVSIIQGWKLAFRNSLEQIIQ